MRRLILENYQSPEDVLMLTAAVRDLHLAYPRQFQTDVRTSAAGLWENNPLLTKLSPGAGVETLAMEYPLINRSNQTPYHFIHGFIQFLEAKLGLRIPITAFQGDVYISALEKSWLSQLEERSIRSRFWIVMAGGSTTTRQSGGCRRTTRRLSTTSGAESISCNVASGVIGTRR